MSRPDGVVPRPSSGQRLLLAMLLLRAGHVVSTDALVDELWGKRPPADTAAALRNQMSRLRRLIGLAGGDLVAGGGGYRLRLERRQLDAARFEDLLGSVGSEDGAAALDKVDRALALWRGRALAEFADRPFAQPDAIRLDELRVAAREQRGEVLLALGRAAEAVADLEALVAEHPQRERGRGLLMEALYRQGRHTEALATYQAWRRRLGEDLGLEPSPALQRLEGEILRHTLGTVAGPAAPQTPFTTVTAGLPTFLFTDIESSTRRWAEHPETMPDDLTRHDEILAETIGSHGGEIFKHTGDGCCAAFPSAAAALAAAVDAQRALAGCAWGPGGPLRARIAIHTGPAEARGRDYFGPALNRAARLLGVAHGGQVVLSLAAEEPVVDALPAAVGLRDLGEHRLADLDRPERIFQVTHPELPAHFPPPRSVGSPRHNLPAFLSPFVGRQAELDELSELLSNCRLMTLIGVGGVGKTRLALELARSVLSEFPDGVFLVELASVNDPALVGPEVAAALGMNVEGLDSASRVVEQLCRHLEPRRVLLLLDNCEHLVGAAAELVEAVLGRCPAVVVIATSRESLGVSGERLWRVPSLALPPLDSTSIEVLAAADAVALLCQRTRAVNPDFTLGPANAAAISQICRRLDGIPLALELAAARLQLLTPQQVADRLEDRFRLLTAGARTALPRHQTLRATMDWSYDLLSDAEQAVLRRLSVFPGGFSVDAAQAVTADGTTILRQDVLGVLGSLVDKSLVAVEHLHDEARFRLLETVRQYAAERLAEAGESEAVRRRHRDFFLQLADTTHPDLSFWWDTRCWLARARADDDNFRAALEWSRAAGEPDACLRLAVALSYYYLLEGTPEGADWLEWSLRVSSEPSPARVRGMACYSFFVLQRGDERAATALLHDARALAEELRDPTGAGLADEFLGVFHYGRGDLDTATTMLQEAGRRFEAQRCTAGMWGYHYDLGWVAVAGRDHRLAKDEFERALDIGRSIGSEDLIAHSLAALAPLAARFGEAERAEALAAEAIAITRTLGLRLFVVMALVRAAEVAVLLKSTGSATSLLEALTILGDVGGSAWLGDALELVAISQATTNAPASAARLFGVVDGLIGAAGEQPSIRAIRPEVDHCRIEVAQTLGAASFERELTNGRAMSINEALNFASDVLKSQARNA